MPKRASTVVVTSDAELLAHLKERLRYDSRRGLLFREPGYPGFVGGERVGSPQSGGKLQACFLGLRIQVDRLIWLWETGSLPSGPLLHIDGDPRNDRFSNLRVGRRAPKPRPKKSRPAPPPKPARVRKTPEQKRATRAAYRAAHPEIYASASKRSRERMKRENPERFRANEERAKRYSKTWMKTPKGRASAKVQRQRRRTRLAGAPGVGLTRDEWLAICRSQTDDAGSVCCAYCKRPCDPTVDHVVPLARGGRHEASNIVAACVTCNSSKCDRLITEWERARQLLSEVELVRLSGLTARLLEAT